MSCNTSGFHFLGINYPRTQTWDDTSADHASNDLVITTPDDHKLNVIGEGSNI